MCRIEGGGERRRGDFVCADLSNSFWLRFFARRTAIDYCIASGHGSITRILGERNLEVRKARDLIVRKIRFFCIVRRKVGKGGDVRKEQMIMNSLLTVGGKL